VDRVNDRVAHLSHAPSLDAPTALNANPVKANAGVRTISVRLC
jgi:hypothetical protein